MIYAKKPAWYIIVMAVPGLLWVNINRGSTPTRGGYPWQKLLFRASQVSGACYIYLVTRKYAQFKSLNRWKEWVGPKAIFYLNRNLKKPIGLKGFSEWSQKLPPPPNGKTASKVHFRVSGGGIFFKIMYVYSHGYKTQPVLRMNLLSTIFRLSICITLCPGPGRI